MVITGEKSFEELHTLALTAARNIHLQDEVEHGRSIDKYGNVRKFTGGEKWVDIDVDENTRITIHNHRQSETGSRLTIRCTHPSPPQEQKIPETFSGDDVYHFLINKQLCEIIVCGYGYYFYLRRGTFRGREMPVWNEICSIFSRVKDRVLKEYAKDPLNLAKSMKTKEKEVYLLIEEGIHEEVSRYLASKGLSYGRSKL